MNIERITRALKQIEMEDVNVVPKIVCLPFQKNVLIRALLLFKCQKTIIVTLDKRSIYRIFPELTDQKFIREPYRTNEGGYMEVNVETSKRTNKEMDKKEYENI